MSLRSIVFAIECSIVVHELARILSLVPSAWHHGAVAARQCTNAGGIQCNAQLFLQMSRRTVVSILGTLVYANGRLDGSIHPQLLSLLWCSPRVKLVLLLPLPLLRCFRPISGFVLDVSRYTRRTGRGKTAAACLSLFLALELIFLRLCAGDVHGAGDES